MSRRRAMDRVYRQNAGLSQDKHDEMRSGAIYVNKKGQPNRLSL